MTTSLKDKVALIAGASSGIGRATAVHFASLGCKLAIAGRNTDTLQEAANQCKGAADVLQVPGDLTVEEDVQRLINTTIEHYQRLDVLVNSVGIYRTGGIENSSLQQYDTVMNTNVRSIYNVVMLAVPHLVATKGSIVIVSSINGLRSFKGVLAHCMAKAALDQFVRCVALELAPKQVRVNSVNPGATNTPILMRNGLTVEQFEQFKEHVKTTHALGRIGEPEEVAKAIAFLASDDASFITGVQLPVDGGRQMMCPK